MNLDLVCCINHMSFLTCVLSHYLKEEKVQLIAICQNYI